MYIRNNRNIFYKIEGMMQYVDNAKSRYIKRIIPIIIAAEDNKKYNYALKMYDNLLNTMTSLSKKYFIPESWFIEIKERNSKIEEKMKIIKINKEEYEEYIKVLKRKIKFFVKLYICVWIAVILISIFTYLTK